MSQALSIEEAARRYAAFYETLTPTTLQELPKLCRQDVHFRDPFNDVVGIKPVTRIFAQMFEDVLEPAFLVSDIAISGDTCYLRWTMTFRRKPGEPPWRIEGMSEVRFDEAGQVAAHIDHWDAAAQLYERVPLLGSLIRLVKRRLSLPPEPD